MQQLAGQAPRLSFHSGHSWDAYAPAPPTRLVIEGEQVSHGNLHPNRMHAPRITMKAADLIRVLNLNGASHSRTSEEGCDIVLVL
jgi:hypothetical protein